MRVMLFECSQRSMRWGLLLPVEAGAPEWRGVDVRALAVFPREPEGVEALRDLEARLRGDAGVPASGSAADGASG